MRSVSLYIMMLCCFVSCVTTKKTNYLQDPNRFVPAYGAVPRPDDYTLQVGDVLSVYVYSLDKETNRYFNTGADTQTEAQGGNSSTSYVIQHDSCIYYPVVGKVKVAGITQRDAVSVLKNALSEKFIKNDLSVRITLQNDKVYLVTDAKSTAVDLKTRQMNIFEVLASASDLQDYSDRGHVKILRNTPEGSVLKEFDLRSKSLLQSEFYYVQPNDVIYVQSFRGQFFRFGSFLSVLSTVLSVVSLGIFVYGICTRF